MAVITLSNNAFKLTADEDEILERLKVTSFRFYPGSGGGTCTAETKIVSWDNKGALTEVASGSGQTFLTLVGATGETIDVIGEGWYDGIRIIALTGTGAYLLINVE